MKIFISLLIVYTTLFADVGTIALLKGEATIKRGSIILDAKMGNELQNGDQIDTYKKTRMQIIFDDNTIVTLGSNTKYIINSFNNTNDLHMKMTLKRGFLKTITGRIGKLAPSRFKLKTKSATIGIRGTGWKTYIGENIENSVCFKGAITIDMPNKSFELPAGNMLLTTDKFSKKVKIDMKFFNTEIEKDEAKQKPKIKLKITNPIKKEIQKLSKKIIVEQKVIVTALKALPLHIIKMPIVEIENIIEESVKIIQNDDIKNITTFVTQEIEKGAISPFTLSNTAIETPPPAHAHPTDGP